MGVALTELLVMKEIDLDFLRNKVLVVDAPMWLYQFLSSIRQRDGSLLTDSEGNVTSHLMGLMTRISNLSQQNIKLAFVFDGEPPKLKKLTLEKRKETKIEAQKKFERAKEKEDLELMKKYAARTSRLTPEMIDEAKKLVEAFGLPAINAPSEAEAQASFIVKNGDAFALATNDADALLFESPQVVRNLNMAGKKKRTNKLSYETINPELIRLEENLKHLGISQEQLIALAMLIGTDYNAGGIKGIGPKNALKLVKKYGNNLDTMFKEAKWSENFDFSWNEVFDLIKSIDVDKDYGLEWSPVDEEKIMKLLVDKHDFSEERVKSQVEALVKENKKKNQKGLSDFFN
ncbi:flap endonuclease-1 [Candidatus Woesearchaeota archaeon]|jgi:flap endonuclease-1|nr:flap endonuclease-1 [Candidatus Woesearchaeota archaeon]MDP6647949.1 flap endonuclease-1 [Candidatus Woesearchaeota archaeon]|tara:strand:- start:14652 stop:15689 length:1038 start_codon:yes stop_codon:yes gene_type:complete